MPCVRMFKAKTTEVSSDAPVYDLRLAVGLWVIRRRYFQLGALLLKDGLPQFASEYRVLIRNDRMQHAMMLDYDLHQ